MSRLLRHSQPQNLFHQTFPPSRASVRSLALPELSKTAGEVTAELPFLEKKERRISGPATEDLRMFLKLNVLVVVAALALLAREGEGAPTGEHWEVWRQLQKEKREQQQAQQQQQMQTGRRLGGLILEAADQYRLKQQLLEQEQERQEQMEELISDNNLEEFSMLLRLDTLGRILRPLLNEQHPPTHHVVEGCVTRTAPVSFMHLQLWGHFVYTVCGSGDGASMHIHFQRQGATTPSLDTTTATEAATTAPAQPLCPTPSPTTPASPDVTPTEPGTTASAEADVTTTTTAAV